MLDRSPSWSRVRKRAAGALLFPALLIVEACSSPQAPTPKPGLLPPGGPAPAGQPARGPAGPESAGSDEAEPDVLRCPAQDSDHSRAGERKMASGGRLCCLPRSPAPGFVPFDYNECLRSAAPALAPVLVPDRSLDLEPLLDRVAFDRGSAKLGGPLTGLAQRLTAKPGLQLYLHGTTRCGEARSEAAAARLAADRVAAVRNELTQHGVEDSQLVIQDRADFLRQRDDLRHNEVLTELDTSSVLLYGPRGNIAPRSTPPHSQCIPGAVAKLLLPTAELQGSRLAIEACHAARCAGAELALDTLREGDTVALALKGGLSAGAQLAWNQPDGAVLEVGTAMADKAKLASGDWFSLRVQVDGRVVLHVEEPLKYTQEKNFTASGGPCLRAQVRGDVPFL
ncbi:hypothetical protein [Sorangium sp. So ce1099]|uniref:hypothetical protein n=1 Tax=Sorangium sp. So ce1099 TaxID=3133331 RepID=UPI003F624A2D